MRQFRDLKFRRQHPVGPYIVDFYCAIRRLAVELDGGQHFTVEGQAYDRRRTAYLAAQGVAVVRFTNEEMMVNTEGVLEELWRHLGRGSPLTLSLSPLRGARGPSADVRCRGMGTLVRR